MTEKTATVVREGFQYLEGARWFRGELWCSDIPQGKVYRIRPETGEVNIAAEVSTKPSGLGFRPDGTPLVVTQEDNTLSRITPDGGTEIVVSLADVAIKANDMWVDNQGRAYISQIGYDLFAGEEVASSSMIVVSPDGEISVAGSDLLCPNGVGLSPDGKTLYVAETFAFRLTAFDVDGNGQLSNQRVAKQFDSLEVDALDGLCVDSAGGVWLTSPFSSQVRRMLPDGTITDTVKTATPGHFVVSVALGGPDLRTLYMCTCEIDMPRLQNNFDGVGRIEKVEVDVPGMQS